MNPKFPLNRKHYRGVIQDHHSLAAGLAVIVVLIIGVYGSLKVTTSLFGIEADSSHSIMLWHGVNTHGLAWLKDWLFTSDNWLLSLVPFHFLGFLIFGVKPAVVILSGWLIFMFSAFISGAIAWQLKAKKAAILIFLALLFLGFYSHASGFASYSTSHNITNLFGLVVIYLILKWSEKPNILTLVAVLAILIAGAVSDPWMIASYNLPIALTGVVLFVFPTGNINRTDSFKLIFTSILSIFSVKTKMFGILYFTESMNFSPGNMETIKNNIFFLIKNLGGLLNIIPLTNGNDFIHASLTLIAIFSLLTYSTIKAINYSNKLTSTHIVFILLFTFSIVGITFAFAIRDIKAEDYSGRFLLNCAYLIPIGLGVLLEYNWKNHTIIEKYICTSIILLFVISGIISNFQLWRKPGFAFKDTGTLALINYLKTNKLSYGYGPYWGANANAITAMSNSEVIIRPVRFNKYNGMIAGLRPESSNRWYSREDFSPHQKEFFIFIVSDGEECADVNLCISGLTKQFGNPTRILFYQSATILVWNHPLIGYPPSPM